MTTKDTAHPTVLAVGPAAGLVVPALFALLQPALLFQNFDRGWAGVVRTGVYAEPYRSASAIARSASGAITR